MKGKSAMKDVHKSKQSIRREVTRAKATTVVHMYDAAVYDDPKEGPHLIKGHLEESFTGDIEGDGVVDTLQAVDVSEGSSIFVGIERVKGKIGVETGSFLLQVAGTVERKIVSCDWFVIQGSGTGQLAGLRGEGGFRAELGKGGEAYLDYWIEKGS